MFARPLHPFLLALFPVLFLFSNNMDIVLGREVAVPLIASLLMATLVFFSFRLITGNYKKAGLITSGFLLLFFLYGAVRDIVFSPNAESSVIINVSMLAVWTIIFVLFAMAITRTRGGLDSATKFMNIVALALLVLTQISIGVNYSKAVELASREKAEAADVSSLTASDSRPDIYYIILDRYGRQDAVKESFNYNNSKFINYLEDKGFYVAGDSSSNYSDTEHSLPSSLNMRYLTNEEETEDGVLLSAWRNNRVMESLRSIGYRNIFIDGDLRFKNIKKYAQVFSYSGVLGMPTGPFEEALCDMTVLSPFSKLLSGHGAAVTYALNTIPNISDNGSPKFVYAHIICPHPPYIFNARGEDKFKLFEDNTDDETGYPSNLDFINGQIRTVIDKLLSKSRKPIIILQGDHFMNFNGQHDIYKILNAYYFPDKNYSELYENISPVNTFRIIFDLYFNGNYDTLQDISYYWDPQNNSFVEYTQQQ
jgi:hypothetical protein